MNFPRNFRSKQLKIRGSQFPKITGTRCTRKNKNLRLIPNSRFFKLFDISQFLEQLITGYVMSGHMFKWAWAWVGLKCPNPSLMLNHPGVSLKLGRNVFATTVIFVYNVALLFIGFLRRRVSYILNNFSGVIHKPRFQKGAFFSPASGVIGEF